MLLVSIQWSSHFGRTSFRRPIAMCVRSEYSGSCWRERARRASLCSGGWRPGRGWSEIRLSFTTSCILRPPHELTAEITGSPKSLAHARTSVLRARQDNRRRPGIIRDCDLHRRPFKGGALSGPTCRPNVVWSAAPAAGGRPHRLWSLTQRRLQAWFFLSSLRL